MRVVVVFALALVSAKPPEPLEEIFPQTQLIVDATVVELRAADPPDATMDVVVLEVKRVVRGTLKNPEVAAAPSKLARIAVLKPKSATYKLRVGVTGPWLLHVDDKTGAATVLGRYGPDSWTFEKIDAKLKALDPPQLRP